MSRAGEDRGQGGFDALRPGRSFVPVRAMVPLFTAGIFVGAALLFLVQPMFARFVLPHLGGSPSVWATAMVFFQAMLLAGYAYAHFGVTRLGGRTQRWVHLLVLLAPFAVLPLGLPAGWAPSAEGSPVWALLALMVVTVGLPFFALSTTSPVLQSWFATSGHARARDPYFLYAASNVGSLLALLAYPIVVEPRLTLVAQAAWWKIGYGAFVVLVAACAVVARPARRSESTFGRGPVVRLPWARRGRWVLLAAVPSSLMVGVTTFVSSEVAVVPLLWVVPLGLYLATFVVAFGVRSQTAGGRLARVVPMVLTPLAMVLAIGATQPIALLAGLHLLTFALIAWWCHAALAADRPDAAALTEFYLWLAVGGVVGGAFNGLVAPVVFAGVAEYPIALVVGAWLVVTGLGREAQRWTWRDLAWPAGLGALCALLAVTVRGVAWGHTAAGSVVVFGVPALIGYFFSERAVRYALGLAVLLVAGARYRGEQGTVLETRRSFFGVHRVALSPDRKSHLLVHGRTLHGRQALAVEQRGEPSTYYHRTGPVGDVMGAYGRSPKARIGAVGLGVGTLAAYAVPGQTWTFFEIDPVVVSLARDTRYFHYLADAAAPLRVVVGDARLTLTREAEATFDLIVLDAYSSDAIPVHLVTREALALYMSRLAPRGVLACHLSNVHLDLEPVFTALANDAGLACVVRDDTSVSEEAAKAGKSPSLWMVMARDPVDLAPIGLRGRWSEPRSANHVRVWTDDYSDLLGVLRWR